MAGLWRLCLGIVSVLSILVFISGDVDDVFLLVYMIGVVVFISLSQSLLDNDFMSTVHVCLLT